MIAQLVEISVSNIPKLFKQTSRAVPPTRGLTPSDLIKFSHRGKWNMQPDHNLM